MKPALPIGLLAAALAASTAFAQAPYPGNDCDDGVARPHGQLDPYTGNASFASRDIVVAGAVGRYGLVWTRHARSRTTQNESFFGAAHNWAHCWQWEMVDEGADAQGRAVVSVRHPDGSVHRFTETAPGEWWSAPSVRDRVVSDHDAFHLLRFDASEVRFTRQPGPTGVVFVATEVVDPEGNIWKLQYSEDRLVRVTEPAGRWLQISYGTLASPSADPRVPPFRVITQVAASDGQVVKYDYGFPGGADYPVLTGAEYADGTTAKYRYSSPQPGTRLLLTQAIDPRANRYVRGRAFHYQAADDSAFGQIAEITAVDTGGTIWGLRSDPGRSRSYAVMQDTGAVEYRTFNPGGNIAEEIDGRGFAMKYDYDEQGRGFPTGTTDQLGNVTRRENGPSGMAVRQTWPDGSVSAWTRDDRGRLLAETDELGHATKYSRDQRGRATKVSFPDGSADEFAYNDFGQVTMHKGRDGAVTTMDRDDRGLLQAMTDPLGARRIYAYDAQDRLAAITDPRGRATRYGHDAAGRIDRIAYVDGVSTTLTYDAFGDVALYTDAMGGTRTMVYDELGRLTAKFDALGNETDTVYAPPSAGAPVNREIAVVAPSGRRTGATYDPDGRVTARTQAANTRQAATTRYTYDALGRRSSVTDARGKTIRFSYDARGRLIRAVDALNHATAYTYDAAGHKVSQTDARGSVTQWTYDTMGRELTKSDALGHTITRTYDGGGRLSTLTDPKGSVYRFEYNALGRPTALVFPDGSRETTLYDDVGNRLSFTNRAGLTQSFKYDDRNREIRSEWSDGSQTVVRSYDAAGRMTLEDNGVSRISYGFDAAGRLKSETQDLTAVGLGGLADPAARTVTYDYNADGQREWLRYPDGTAVKYVYNARGQLADILGDGTPPPIASYVYDDAGNATQMPRENLTETRSDFDDGNRVTTILDQSATSGSLSLRNYAYDEVNNRTVAAITGFVAGTPESREEKYDYDASSQLVGAETAATSGTGPGREAPSAVGFRYDAVGNRIQKDENGEVTLYTVNKLNQYTQVGAFAPAYDGNGNLAAMGRWLYTFDALNRLVSASDGTRRARFFYDSKNRCVARSYDDASGSPADVTLDYYDRWNLIAEYNPRGDRLARYVHGRRTDEIVLMVNRHGAFYPHYDALGNVTMLTDSAGKLVEKYRYSVEGRVSFYDGSGREISASAVDNRWLFNGREWLAPVGLYDYRNRVYSAELGRFMQTDPTRFAAGDINIYRYCGNMFTMKTDPDGRGLLGALIDGVAGAVGAAAGALAAGQDWDHALVAGAIGGAVGVAVGLIDPSEGIFSAGSIGDIALDVAVAADVGGYTDLASQMATNAMDHPANDFGQNWNLTDWGSVDCSAVVGAMSSLTETATAALVTDMTAALTVASEQVAEAAGDAFAAAVLFPEETMTAQDWAQYFE